MHSHTFLRSASVLTPWGSSLPIKKSTFGKWRPAAVHALAVALAVHKRVAIVTKRAKMAKVRMVMYDGRKKIL